MSPTRTTRRADILIAANYHGDVYKIDQTTGAATKIGSYGTVTAGKVVSSGDIIGVRGLGIYATVKVGTETERLSGADRSDDVQGIADRQLGTGTGFKDIFGLALLGGHDLSASSPARPPARSIKIDPTTGAGTEVLERCDSLVRRGRRDRRADPPVATSARRSTSGRRGSGFARRRRSDLSIVRERLLLERLDLLEVDRLIAIGHELPPSGRPRSPACPRGRSA